MTPSPEQTESFAREKDLRYWNNPKYREARLKYAAEYREKHRNDPLFKRIRDLECAIFRRKKSIQVRQQKIFRLEKSLCELSRQLVKARAKWKESRCSETN
jgi:hypothetical protein